MPITLAPHLYAIKVLVNDANGKFRFLCSCLAGTGVPGGKNEPMPVSLQWTDSHASAVLQGRVHLQTHR